MSATNAGMAAQQPLPSVLAVATPVPVVGLMGAGALAGLLAAAGLAGFRRRR